MCKTVFQDHCQGVQSLYGQETVNIAIGLIFSSKIGEGYRKKISPAWVSQK